MIFKFVVECQSKNEHCLSSFDFALKFNWLPLQHTLSDKTNVRLIICIHISSNAENLVKIGLVFAEIVDWICQFLMIRLFSKHTLAL